MEYFQEFQQHVREEYPEFIEEIKSNLAALPEEYQEDADAVLVHLPELEKVYKDFSDIEDVTVQDAKAYREKVWETTFMQTFGNFLGTISPDVQTGMSTDAIKKMTASITALNLMLLINGELN